MLSEFETWLQGVDNECSHRQETITTPDKPIREKKVVTPTDTQAESVLQKSSRGALDSQEDIDILQKTYGELMPGMVITIPLPEACELLGRTRRRVDAFKRLQKVLKTEYEVELIITSMKTHGKN